MCKSPLHPLLHRLPKTEHHIHVEGALTPSLLFTLASRNNITLPPTDQDASFASQDALLARYQRFTSLDDFLHYYYVGMSVLIHAADYEALAWDYFTRAHADGVRHAEVFFDPQAHLSRGVAYATVLAGLTRAKERAKSEFGISVEFVCCFLRHLPVPDSVATFGLPEVRASFEDGRVIGIGLDSTEKDMPPSKWEEIYKAAGPLGVRRTAHAGEEGPAGYIAEAIDTLGCERIDHGLRLVEDPDLMKRVAEKGIMLTLCPISNVFLKCVKNMKEVPIRKLLDAGVKFSINSDDPAYFGGYILDNYCAVQDAFDLSVEEWQRICRTGIEGSWCGQARKNELLEELEKVVTDWKASGT
ncbi:adenosine deaminase [Aulographum hederae CBS 113979]|uniref:Adenine deaminase n=1 Tax=Aulographum hederae CBS 113979 TaxID=1176131 RepID=A0A6G1GWS8_9PEZI|nr:adenosine deaminase [Aulographum hederae CBS 113979]